MHPFVGIIFRETLVQGIARIAEEVEEQLLQLLRIASYQGQVIDKLDFQIYTFIIELSTDQHQGIGQDITQVQRYMLGFVLTRNEEQLLDDTCDPITFLNDPV